MEAGDSTRWAGSQGSRDRTRQRDRFLLYSDQQVLGEEEHPVGFGSGGLEEILFCKKDQ